MFAQPNVKKIWNVVRIIKITRGFSFGLYLFIWGAYFYEKFGGNFAPRKAILLITILLALYQGMVLLLEVPTGAIGDTIGRVRTVVWSIAFKTIFFLCLAITSFVSSVPAAFSIAVIVNIVAAISTTLYSGTFIAWCVDSLRERAPDIGYEHVSSRGFTYEFSSQIVGTIIGITCYHFELICVSFLLGALACFACAIYCHKEMEEVKSIEFLSGRSVSTPQILARMHEIIAVGVQVCRRSSAILWLILTSSAVIFLVNVVDYLWPVYVKANIGGIRQIYYWMVLAMTVLAFNLLGSCGATWIFSRWKNKGGLKTSNVRLRYLFIFTCLIPALFIIALGFNTARGVDTLTSFAITVAIVECSYGLCAPCYQALLNNYIPGRHSPERATIMSWASVIKSVIVMLLVVPAGGQSGARTTVGWVIPGFLLLFAAILANHFLKQHEGRAGRLESLQRTPFSRESSTAIE